MWPLIAIFLKQDLEKFVWWCLAVASFYVWYFFWLLAGDWDPSGHISALLIMLVLIRSQTKFDKITIVGVYFSLIFLASLQCVYWTSYVFHTVLQSLFGYFSGLFILGGSYACTRPVYSSIQMYRGVSLAKDAI